MTKLLTFIFSVCLVLLLALPAEAGMMTMDQATLLGMSKTWDSGGATSSGLSIVAEGAGVRASAQLQAGDATGDGWASMGIGYGWQPPAGLNDLTGYDGYTLTFLNTNNSAWLVNIYLNTGWTDAPYSEPDNFYESDWVKLLPGVSTTVVMDFATEGVINLNHVTNIGFQVGGDMDVYPYYDSDNPSNPDTYHIDVVPEPATLALLGLGGLALLKRRRS